MASAARNDFERFARFDSASRRRFVSESMRIERVSLLGVLGRTHACTPVVAFAIRDAVLLASGPHPCCGAKTRTVPAHPTPQQPQLSWRGSARRAARTLIRVRPQAR